jgi:hypothetical protein
LNLDIRITAPALLAAAAVVAAGLYWHSKKDFGSTTKIDTSSLTPEAPIVISTNGGELTVATVTAKERFSRESAAEIFGQELPLGRTKSHVQTSVTYRYYIEMEKKWPVSISGKTAVVRSPEIKPSLPVAFDTATVEKYTESGWARFDKNENLRELEKTMTGQLQARALSPQYDQIVRDAARVTVKSFVATWLLGTRQWGSEPEYNVVVLFPGETAEGLSDKARPTH